MTFILVAVLTAGVAVLLRRHPTVLMLMGLTLHCAVPSVLAVSRVQIARLSIHPGSFLMIWAFVVVLVWHRATLAAFVGRWIDVVVAAAGVAAASLIHALLVTGGTPSFGFSLDQALTPMLALVTVGALAAAGRAVEAVRWTLIGIAAAAAVLALAQEAAQSIILFADAFAQQEWAAGRSDLRWMATFDHPLVLSMVLATATPLLAEIRRWWLALSLLGLYMMGIAVTQSRFGLAIGLLAAAYVLVFGRRSAVVTVVALVAAAAAATLAVAAGLFSGVLERFHTADDSTQARVDALLYFLRILPDYVWMGDGVGASYTISARAGLASSFENSFIMMVLDLGLLSTCLYFGLFVVCLAIGRVRGADRSFGVAGVIALISVLSFSALGVRSAVAPLIWVVAAAAAFGPVGRHRSRRRSTRRRGVRVERPRILASQLEKGTL